MAKIDPDRERQRLNALYVQMSDLELEKVGSDPAALTEWARESLRQEMDRRGLKWQEREAFPAELPDDNNVLLVLRFYEHLAPAAEDRRTLQKAGIEAHFFGESAPGPAGLVSWVPRNGVRILVRTVDLAVSLELIGELPNRDQLNAQLEPDSKEQSKPAVLRSYRDITAALADRTALESAGIECFLYDENLVRLDWFVSNAIGGVKLVVSERDVAEAGQILQAS